MKILRIYLLKKLNTLLSEINYFFWIHDRIPYFHTQIIYEKTKNNDAWVLTDEERKLSLAVLIQNINVSESERRIIMRSYAIHLLVRVKL